MSVWTDVKCASWKRRGPGAVTGEPVLGEQGPSAGFDGYGNTRSHAHRGQR